VPENLTPEQARQRFNHASALYREGKYTEALAELNELAKVHPAEIRILAAQQKCWEALEKATTATRPETLAASNVTIITIDDILGPARDATPNLLQHTSQRRAKKTWIIAAVSAGILALAGTYYALTATDNAQDERHYALAAADNPQGKWHDAITAADNTQDKRHYALTSTDRPQGKWHFLMIANVAFGFVEEFAIALEQLYEIPRERLKVLSYEQEETPQLTRYIVGPPHRPHILHQLADIRSSMEVADHLFIIIACHTTANTFAESSACGTSASHQYVVPSAIVAMSFGELNNELSRFRGAGTKVVLVEGCYSGGALDHLHCAEVVYTAGTRDQSTYGGFLCIFQECFHKGIVESRGLKPDTFRKADTNADGVVTLGEAFAFSSQKEMMDKWYRPIWGGPGPTPLRRSIVGTADYALSFE